MPKWKPRHRPGSTCRAGARGTSSGLQVMRLEPRAVGAAETQSVRKIVLQITIFGTDGVEGGGEERGVHRSQYLPDILGQIVAGGGITPVVAVGQQIVFRNHI